MRQTLRNKARARLLDDGLTPSEIARVIDRMGSEIPFSILPLLQSGQSASAYLGQRISRSAYFYTANRQAETLLVALCGTLGRLGVPTSYFLQMLNEDLYDVLLLKDYDWLHYDKGVKGLSRSLLETAERIKERADDRGYKKIITFGTSMGGLPALRIGLLLQAEQAVSVGGRFVWHPTRLRDGRETTGAFDALCACNDASKTHIVNVFARANREDAEAAQTLKATLPSCQLISVGLSGHNVAGQLHELGLSRWFYAMLFGEVDTSQFVLFDRCVSDLSALVMQTALASSKREESLRKQLATQVERGSRLQKQAASQTESLKAIYGSRSWRYLQPIRRLYSKWRRVSCV